MWTGNLVSSWTVPPELLPIYARRMNSVHERDETRHPSLPRARRAIRWWPVILIVGLGATAWLAIWQFWETTRQSKHFATAALMGAIVVLLVIWCLAFSGLRWRWRFWITGTVLGLILLVPLLFEVRGVTGDFLPILQWRWKRSAPPPLIAEGAPGRAQASGGRVGSTNDFPQFLGPNRDGMLRGPRLATSWKKNPPRELWRRRIGAGWSGFAVTGSLALTQEQRGSRELVTCYDLNSGRLIWSHADEARYFTTIAGEGPRATPTVRDSRVYALGATGILNCLDLVTGERLWSKNVIIENESVLPDWGMSGSPLVFEDLVVVSAGGASGRSLVAYARQTGERVWAGGNDRAHYSSPNLVTLDGTRQILIFNARSIASHEASSGQVLWTYAWRAGHPHVAMPIRLPQDRVLISSGYGTGSELLEVRRSPASDWEVDQIWKSHRLKSKFANLIYHDGNIYGLDDGILVCLDAADGSLQWKEGRYGHGQLLLVASLLLIMAENGGLVLVQASPDRHRELTRFSAFNSKTWNPPALAGDYLVVRNDVEAACFRLPLDK